jgi:hypothetical protein
VVIVRRASREKTPWRFVQLLLHNSFDYANSQFRDIFLSKDAEVERQDRRLRPYLIQAASHHTKNRKSWVTALMIAQRLRRKSFERLSSLFQMSCFMLFFSISRLHGLLGRESFASGSAPKGGQGFTFVGRRFGV